jgi:hypothetical protein
MRDRLQRGASPAVSGCSAQLIQLRERCTKVFKKMESVKVQKFKRPHHIATTNDGQFVVHA